LLPEQKELGREEEQKKDRERVSGGVIEAVGAGKSKVEARGEEERRSRILEGAETAGSAAMKEEEEEEEEEEGAGSGTSPLDGRCLQVGEANEVL